MTKRCYGIIWILLFICSFTVHAQMDITISDTTVCKATTFNVCAATPSSTLSNISFDDEFSTVINIGFPFTFYGQSYSQCVISDNNFISFNTALAGQHSDYVYASAETAGELNNVIMFPFQDLNVATYPVSTIRYMTTGKAPNRRFVVEFCRVGYYQCTSMETINQLILYETSNVIEMHINKKQNCTSWPSTTAVGKGVQGVRGTTTASGVFIAGRGPTSAAWTVTIPEAQRFTPSGSTYTTSSITYAPVLFFNPGGSYTWYKGNSTTPYANTNCVSITTDTATDYYIAKYTGTIGCNSTTVTTLYDTLNINYLNPYVPITLSYCSNQLPVTWNGLTIPAGATTQSNYDTINVTGANICDTNFVINLNIQQAITPAFTQVAPVCSGGTLAALPTTSTNGISGTWSPALNNTATTTYTFTPTAGSCATTASMTITVNPNVTPTFTQVAPICSGGTLAALPTTSTNNITGTWSPALNNTATTTYTFTPTAGSCATTASMTVTVNPNVAPIFIQVAPICAGGTLNALPTTSTNGISGTWSPALNNTTTTTYTFTPTAGLCATTASMTITVNPNVTPAFTQVAPVCAGTAASPLVNTSTNGINGTWAPAWNNSTTTTYTFTPNAGLCATTTTMTVTINPNITPTFTQVPPVCIGTTLSPLPTTSLNGYTGTWSPALNNTVTTTYTFTPTAGQCATTATMTIQINNNILPAFTQVAPICAGATLSPLPSTSNNSITGTWAPALNNTATTTYTFTPSAGQCAIPATMTIVVNPILTPVFTPVGPICSGGALSALPATSTNGISGTWSPALNNAATTTYTFSPNAGQCANNTTMTITVNPNVTPTFTQVAPICTGSPLAALPVTSNNGISGVWTPAMNNAATTTYTFTPAAGICATTTTMTIVVNPPTVPAFTQIPAVCINTPLAALPTTSNNNISGIWSPAVNNTATTTYTFTPSPGQCATPTTMTIVINPYLTGNRNVHICEGNSYTFNGITYTASVSGVKDTVPNANACDSIITLNLAVHAKTYGIQQATICAGNSYTFNGIVYTAPNNTAKDTLVNANGCDSIVTLNLNVVAVNPVTTSQALTSCGSITFNGVTYTANATVSDTLHTIYGCDSIYRTTQLTVYPEYHITQIIDTTSCANFVYNGVTYTQDALVKDTFKTSHGCDSMIRDINIRIVHFDLQASINLDNPYEGQEVTISTHSADGQSYSVYSWTPASAFADQQSLSQSFKAATGMTVVISGTSEEGCTDTAKVSFAVRPYRPEVMMPNAFTPNGDGVNDVFMPVLAVDDGYQLTDFRIVNRWGQLLFSTAHVNIGWDGTFKGQLQSQDVYCYLVTIVFLDGTTKTFKGDVTLLR